MYLMCQLAIRFIGVPCNQVGEFLFKTIGILEGKFLGIFNEVAMVKPGLNAAHDRGKAMFAVVACGVTPLRRVAFGENLVRCSRLLRCEVSTPIVPGAVWVGPGLVGGG